MKSTSGIAEPGLVHVFGHVLLCCVQLWLTDLDLRARAIGLEGFQADELERAARFRFERDRSRFLAARHALREVLGGLLGETPAHIRIELDAGGKPRLSARHAALHFNISHSAQACLIGVSRDAPIGVDIELQRPLDDAQTLARSHFTDREFAAWSALGAAERDFAFLRCWTRKEACLKAAGTGLSVEPRSVQAGIEDRPCTVLIGHDNGLCATTVWPLSIPPLHSAVAAIALAGPHGHEPDLPDTPS